MTIESELFSLRDKVSVRNGLDDMNFKAWVYNHAHEIADLLAEKEAATAELRAENERLKDEHQKLKDAYLRLAFPLVESETPTTQRGE